MDSQENLGRGCIFSRIKCWHWLLLSTLIAVIFICIGLEIFHNGFHNDTPAAADTKNIELHNSTFRASHPNITMPTLKNSEMLATDQHLSTTPVIWDDLDVGLIPISMDETTTKQNPIEITDNPSTL